MLQTLIKNWWLLAFCGILDATLAALNLFMFAWDGSPAWGTFAIRGASLLMSRIALAAGLCTIAAGIWSFGNGRSWLLVLNGLAFSAYGLIPRLWRGPLSFLFFARLLDRHGNQHRHLRIAHGADRTASAFFSASFATRCCS